MALQATPHGHRAAARTARPREKHLALGLPRSAAGKEVRKGLIMQRRSLVILTAAACLLAGPLAVAAEPDTAALAKQVKLMEDREEIRALIIEYARVLDKRDFAAYGKLFTRDGQWKGSFGVTRTPQGIQAMM